MADPKGLSVDELYAWVTKHLTPEEALRRMLTASIYRYENINEKLMLKGADAIQPEIIIVMAAMDLGWLISTEKVDSELTDLPVRGICVGTREYMESVFKRPLPIPDVDN